VLRDAFKKPRTLLKRSAPEKIEGYVCQSARSTDVLGLSLSEVGFKNFSGESIGRDEGVLSLNCASPDQRRAI
jgi:hypothetical protein